MTNHWNDIDNTSMALVFGANPAENHPACMGHVNAARFGTKKARLVVVDPRLTRTARQIDPNRKNLDGQAEPDFYVRIRPGTNVAFANGLTSWIMNNIGTYNPAAAANMLAFHNGTHANFLSVGRTFVDDAGTTRTLTGAELLGAKYDGTVTTTFASVAAGGYPKYCDSRFKVDATGSDYQHGVLTTASYNETTSTTQWKFTGFPVVANDISDPACVYQKLLAHVAPYTPEVVADICGCTPTEVINVAKALIDNSRFNSVDAVTGAAANGATPQVARYRAATILYAMGQTQHTNGSQNIKALAVLQTILGNMGRPGGGINALRGIHNVQGSTDFGLLFDSIPGYSGNPGAGEHYTHYSNALFGNRVEGGGAKTWQVPANLGLQQRGFHNMTQEWFGNGLLSSDGQAAGETNIEKLYRLWPKGNGVQHIQSFRYMTLADTDANKIKAAVVWGQNPAVTEPNQSKVRAGLKNLDLLVVVDTFETETAAVDRKDNAPTYLIPAASYIEEAGSVTNSGRWLQWRERATAPKGNSKSDIELLLRFAYALDKAGAFAHITNVAYDNDGTGVPTSGVWSEVTPKIAGPAYKVLYGDKFGWSPAGATAFEDLSVTTEMWAVGASTAADRVVKGSEVVCEKVFIEIARPLDDTTTSGGTMWIYSGAGAAAGYRTTLADVQPATGDTWAVKNRAKSRNRTRTGAAGDNNALNYPRWGWAWLLNRRVFYNNSEVAMDVADVFVAPGVVCGLFTIKDTGALLADWSLLYRKYKNFNDVPSVVAVPDASSPHFVAEGLSFAGRFPGHTEPYESPRNDLVATWGHNTSKGARLIVEGADGTPVGDAIDYPLVLTTIRCVEHFQGGPTTRNNSWNVEAEPVPWIEINSLDAAKYTIKDGDWVNVITARSNTKLNQEALSPNSDAGWCKGFKARVGVGLQSNQRVAQGVVAIPWHWGDKGLSTGARANDLTIDAWDANTMIPEYKACLCKIEKM